MLEKYNPQEIEPKWQKFWDDQHTFEVNPDSNKPKYYVLEMFPYPSGRIHMGHVRNYSIGDVVARFKRMRGFNVLHPMGYDAFGMPAENAAIKNKTHPKNWTDQNIEEMTVQLKRLGFSYDWRRMVATCHPEYYRWEQKFFIEMFKKGLLYRKNSLVNFCETCATVLANEQVVDGKCWRCDNLVIQKKLEQWSLKITAYAEELLQDLNALEGHWPERVLTMQREWIGKSVGAKVDFKIVDSEKTITVFTTRPDTLFGVTFVALSPEHPLVKELIANSPHESEVLQFCEDISKIKREDRLKGNFEKEGMPTSKYCINPVNNQKIPIYVGNYVLMEYGTGAVMSVPMHDQRDFEFAAKYNLDKILVIQSKDKSLDILTMKEAYTEDGVMVNSQQFDGLNNSEAGIKITEWLASKGLAEKTTNYRLRDWGISRQRYWGTPLPFIQLADGTIVPADESELPIKLPEDVSFAGEGGSPLLLSKTFQKGVEEKYGKGARRETDTMDTFVESSWYFLRYCSINSSKVPFEKSDVSYWGPIDQYIGGIEHAVLHLLYARFFTKVLRDLGYVDLSEPFANLLTQGMVIKDGAKMSKSKGNVVDPNYLIDRYGADTARLFCLFAAPPERDLEWSDQGVEGSFRFLSRIWRLGYELQSGKLTGVEPSKDLAFIHNKTVKKVTEDLDKDFHFNTAIAAIMEYVNYLQQISQASGGTKEYYESFKTLIVMLSPFVPHFSEEMGQMFNLGGKVADQSWPSFDEKQLIKNEVTIAVQINGKLRADILVPVSIAKEDLLAQVKALPKIQTYLANVQIVKEIYVPNKIVNLVVK